MPHSQPHYCLTGVRLVSWFFQGIISYIGELDMYGDDGFAPRRSFAPVKVGDELEVKIEAVGEKGDGIAKKDGFVLFIPNAKEGQQCKIKVTKVLRRVGFAEIVGEGSAASEEDAEEEATEDEEQAPAEDSEDFGDEEETQEETEEETTEEDEEEKKEE